MEPTASPAAFNQCQIKIAIEAPRDRAWKAIIDEIGEWWLPDFHVVDSDSRVSFDTTPGGKGIYESTPSGDWLTWYSVQMYLPSQFQVFLNGHIAPEWGGPTISTLKIALDENETGCIFRLSDARVGRTDEGSMQSCCDDWKRLFTDGLKAHVEGNTGS